jgi:hypothetical protein
MQVKEICYFKFDSSENNSYMKEISWNPSCFDDVSPSKRMEKPNKSNPMEFMK